MKIMSVRTCLAAIAAALLLSVPHAAYADLWDNGAADQDWNNALNWENDVLPAGVNADVNNVSAAVDHPIISADSTFTPVDIHVGTGAGEEGRLDHTAGAVSSGASNWSFIGRGGGTGTYNLADTATSGTGITGFGQGSGTFTTDSFRIALDSNDSVGTVNVNTTGGITASTNEFWIGGNGTGTLNLEAGTLQSGTWFVVGRENGGLGTLNMTGGQINAATTNADAFFVLGSFTGSEGVANVSGGTIDASTAEGFFIAEGGTGTLNVSGSASILGQGAGDGFLRVGLLDGAVGTLNIDGSGATVNANEFSLGLNAAGADTTATGTLNVTADSGGITTINITNNVDLSSPDGDFLTVDLSGYNPGVASDLLLIDGTTSSGEFTGIFQGDSVGFDGAGNEYFIDYNTPGDVILSLTQTINNQWGTDGSGNFSDVANWTLNVPLSTEEALFGTQLQTPDAGVVTLDVPVSQERIRFSSGKDYVIAGPNALTLVSGGTGNAEVVASSGRHWIQAEIAGTAGLNVSGTGEIVLDGTNSFSGNVTVNDAKLTVVDAGAIPAGNNISVTNNGQAAFLGSNNAFFGDALANPAGVATGLDPNTPVTFGGTVSVDDTSTLELTDGANVAFTNTISGAGRVIVNGDDARASFSAANTYEGLTHILNTSTIELSGSGSLGNTGAKTDTIISHTAQLQLNGVSVPATELLVFDEAADGSRAKIASSGSSSVAGNIHAWDFQSGGHYGIEQTDAGTLTLGGTISAFATGQRTFVFDSVDAGSSIVVNGMITDSDVDIDGNAYAGGGAPITGAGERVADGLGGFENTEDNVNIIKRGAGNLTINTGTDNNDDYWRGTTTIEAGTLTVLSDGANNGELRSDVQVMAGATFDISDFGVYNLLPNTPTLAGLSGGGTVNATTLGIFESNTITPGDSAGTLTIDGNVNLTFFDTGASTVLGDGSTVPDSGSFNFELDNSTAGANDLIDVNGTLTITDSSGLGTNQFVVNVTPTSGALATGSNYKLFTTNSLSTAGGATGAQHFVANLVDANGNPVISRQSAAVVFNGNDVELSVTGAPLNLTWTATTNNEWDVNLTSNWNSGAQKFFTGDSTAFNGSGAGTVNVTENVTANAITVSAAEYVYEGSDITAGSVTISSNGTAVVNNSLTGDVEVQNTGTLAGGGDLQSNVTARTGSTIRVGTAGFSTPAAMTLLDNFDGYAVGDTTTATGGVWNAEETAAGTTNIIASDRGNSLQVTGGNGWSGAEADLATNWSAGTAVGATNTYFYQAKWSTDGAAFDIMHGISADVSNIDTTNAWQDFGVMPFMAGAGDGTADFKMTDAGLANDDIISDVTHDQWYNIWYVVDNAAETYDVYVSTGGDDGTYIGTASGYRNGFTGTALNAIGFMAAGAAGSSATIDNIYFFAGGANTGNPVLGGEVLTVAGDVTLEAGSTLAFDLGSTGINDQLDVAGLLTLPDGITVELSFDTSGGTPTFADGDSWDLFNGDTTGSTFDIGNLSNFAYDTGAGLTTGLPTLGASLEWDLSAFLTDGILSVASIAASNFGDFNGDGMVDAQDYAIWREALAQGDAGTAGAEATYLMGNGNGDGIVTTADFDTWIANYGANYLGGSSPSQTPEPTAALLLFSALAGIATRRKRA